MITLKDVALAANMSVTQVSRALNNHDDVSEATKRRVQKIANDMGYIKNITAKNLAMNTINEIALVLKGFEDESNSVDYNPIYPILRGVNKQATDNDYSLVVHILPETVESYASYFSNKGITKAILFGFEYDDPRLVELNNSNLLCVFIDIYADEKNKGCVIINNTLYATKAVEELIASGKEKIAMISGTEHAMVSLEREAGYKIALEKHRKSFSHIERANFQKDDAVTATLSAMRMHPEIDAFFCASDYMALGCMEAIKSLGKRIPYDVAVIGFDNIPISNYTRPPLSTVAQDDYAKGYEAAKLLIKIVNGKDTHRVKTLDCTIKRRGSI